MTIYRLAKSPEDYDKCREKFREKFAGEEISTIKYPTVIAERNGDMVGFLSSYDVPGYSVGAVQADSVHVLMKMFNIYDSVVKSLGKFYYIIHINKDNKTAKRMLDNWKNVTFHKKNGKYLWYIRGL